jgi:hypothetical protein
MLPGETIQSLLPHDIPWWMPDHVVFMGAFYLSMILIFGGFGYAIIKSLKDTLSDSGKSNDHGH